MGSHPSSPVITGATHPVASGICQLSAMDRRHFSSGCCVVALPGCCLRADESRSLFVNHRMLGGDPVSMEACERMTLAVGRHANAWMMRDRVQQGGQKRKGQVVV